MVGRLTTASMRSMPRIFRLTERLVKTAPADMLPSMARTFSVLGAQVRPVAWDPDATLDKFEDEVRMAARVFDPDLLLFPELYLAADDPFAPGMPPGYERRTAEPIPGPRTERIGKVAARVRRWVCAGSVYESDGDHVYNTALVFDPEGRLVASYRKLFPWQPFEETDPGDRRAPVFEVPGVGGVGLMICYDGWFPEVARGLALAGAQLILHPTLTSTPDREQELVLARANAIANQCYVLNVNAVPSVGGGHSIGVDPEGRVLFELGQTEEFVVETIDMGRVDTVREVGTRRLNRVLAHLRDAPRAVFEPYRELLGDAGD
jgi:formamidase